MELDDVAAKALGIEAPELGDVFVGEPCFLEHLRRAPALAEGRKRRGIGTGTVGGDRIAERLIVVIEGDVLIGRRLVEDIADIEADGRGHGGSPLGANATTNSARLRPAGRLGGKRQTRLAGSHRLRL